MSHVSLAMREDFQNHKNKFSMKNKTIFCIMLLAACAFSVQTEAQIKVASTGNVGVAIADTIEPLSMLSIGCAGMNDARVTVCDSGSHSGDQYGMVSHLNMNLSNVEMRSVWGKSTGVALNLTGVCGEAIASSGLGTIPSHPHPIGFRTSACGVYGIAGGSIRDNYGVYGQLQSGGGDGAGVFGTTGRNVLNIGGRYAGFFNGQTKVNGDLYVWSCNIFSPPNPINNTRNTNSDMPDRVLSLLPIQYQLPDSLMDDHRTHYGFDAQELQKLFPELVHEDKVGNVSINYVELIPLLVQTIQKLSAEVTELKLQK